MSILKQGAYLMRSKLILLDLNLWVLGDLILRLSILRQGAFLMRSKLIMLNSHDEILSLSKNTKYR